MNIEDAIMPNVPVRIAKTPIMIRLANDVLKAVDTHSQLINRTRTEVIHRALDEYLARHAAAAAPSTPPAKSRKAN